MTTDDADDEPPYDDDADDGDDDDAFAGAATGPKRDGRRHREYQPPPCGSEKRSALLLTGLTALFQEDGPLAHLLLGEELLLSLVPQYPPGGAETMTAEAFVPIWAEAAPRMTDLHSRRAFREAIALLQSELGDDAPHEHPDRAALAEAHHWIGDRRATGAPAIENVFLQLLFDLSCEAAFLAGWLPPWLAEMRTLGFDGVEEELKERRERRAVQRITHGPLAMELPARLFPSIGDAVRRLAEDDLDPDSLAEAAIDSANRDLTSERRSDLALFFREAARHAALQHRPLTAFDLRAIFEVLAMDGPASDRAARLLYARAIDTHLASSERKRPW